MLLLKILAVRLALRLSSCFTCKGYWPGTGGYVIYSPRGVPEGVARRHATRGIYHISPRVRSITCLCYFVDEDS